MRLLVPHAPDDEVAKILGTAGQEVEGEPLGAGVFELTGFAGVFPLVPGDQVTVVDDQVTGIHKLAPLWVFEVFTRTPTGIGAPSMEDPTKFDLAPEILDDTAWDAAGLAANEVADQLRRMSPIYRVGESYTMTVATTSRVWFDAWREDHPHVQFVQLVRSPESTLDFEKMRRSWHDDREII